MRRGERFPSPHSFLLERSIAMTSLAPHGGCNWQGCTECFPERPDSHKVVSATLHTQGWPDIQVRISEWGTHDSKIDGYVKVLNSYGSAYVVAESRLTDIVWR